MTFEITTSDGSPQLMRSRFKILSQIPTEEITRSFPHWKIEQTDIQGVTANTLEGTPHWKGRILYLHGCGYFSGSLAEYRGFLFKLSYDTRKKASRLTND